MQSECVELKHARLGGLRAGLYMFVASIQFPFVLLSTQA